MEEEKKAVEIEATEECPVDSKTETIKFPWGITIIIGILMALIVACLIVIWCLEH